MCLPTDEQEILSLTGRLPVRSNFKRAFSQINEIAPLTHPYPFVILGYSNFKPQQLEIITIEGDEASSKNSSDILTRSIEFPSQYRQAGINILSFFGSYLREQYPDEDAKVKIEQDGLVVRLIIESKKGKLEVIEKALHEYQLIVSGNEPPESVRKNETLMAELRTEIRMAQTKIEFQNMILGIKDTQIEQQKEMIGQLIMHGLSAPHNINVTVNPIITNTSSVTANQTVNNTLTSLKELKKSLPKSAEVYNEIDDLEASIDSLQKEESPDILKNSHAMRQLKNFIDRVANKEDDWGKTVRTAKKGWEMFKSLAGNYNSIAQWCGLPQVPKMFTK